MRVEALAHCSEIRGVGAHDDIDVALGQTARHGGRADMAYLHGLAQQRPQPRDDRIGERIRFLEQLG